MHAPITLERAIQPKTRDNNTRALFYAGEESVHARMVIRAPENWRRNIFQGLSIHQKSGGIAGNPFLGAGKVEFLAAGFQRNLSAGRCS